MKKKSINIFVIIAIIIVCIPLSFYLKRTVNTKRLIVQRHKMSTELPEALKADLTDHYGMDVEVTINCKTFENKIFQDWIGIDIKKTKDFEKKSNADKLKFMQDVNLYTLDLFHAEVSERYPLYFSVLDEGVSYSVGKEGYISIEAYYDINIKTDAHKYEYTADERFGPKFNFDIDGGNIRVNGKTLQFNEDYTPYIPKSNSHSSSSPKPSSDSSSSSKPHKTYSGSSSSPNPYDVYDYDDPDDFADEWEDEFDDWDDAWDYWDEAH